MAVLVMDNITDVSDEGIREFFTGLVTNVIEAKKKGEPFRILVRSAGRPVVIEGKGQKLDGLNDLIYTGCEFAIQHGEPATIPEE